MFIGKYYYKLQENDRVSIPAPYRKQSKKWIITRGLDGGLFLFKSENFIKEIETLSNKSFTKKANRDLIRIMTNEAKELKVDSNGRVHLPKYLIDYAQLKKEIVLVGSFNKVEIWDQTKYHQYNERLEKQAEEIAETINE